MRNLRGALFLVGLGLPNVFSEFWKLDKDAKAILKQRVPKLSPS